MVARGKSAAARGRECLVIGPMVSQSLRAIEPVAIAVLPHVGWIGGGSKHERDNGRSDYADASP